MGTSATTADLIFVGGPIVTLDDAVPSAEAVAVAGGRIVAVGTAADVMKLRGESTEVVDLAGNVMLPSFIDAHGHFMNALQVVKWANVAGPPVGDVTSIADIVPSLQHHVEKLGIKRGQWIIGYGYDRTNYRDGREATRDDLDPAFPDNPVILIHSSNHGALLNSAALALAGITADTPDPPGGVIVRTPGTTEPAGLLMETAFIPLFVGLPKPSEDEMLDTLDDAQQVYASVGVTTAQDSATGAEAMHLLRRGAGEGRLYLDIVSLPVTIEIAAMLRDVFPDFVGGLMEFPAEALAAFGRYDGRLKLQGIKFLIDGSPQGKTAFWTEPLLTGGPGGESDWRGAPLSPPESIIAEIGAVYRQDLQVFAHANGDAAMDILIDAAQAAGVTAEQDRRTVVIHSQCMRPDQLLSYAELGFSPSFFTVHTFFWGDEHVANLGPERASFISPMKSAVGHGLRCSNHNDFSVTPQDPMRMVWSAVTRVSRTGAVLGPEECVDRLQALKAITIEAAWQIREEDTKGTIAVGKLADLVVLDANPLTVDTDAILGIGVVTTYKEGRPVFQRGS
jgi:predicted amidohydrolase YtcJ